MPVTQNVLNGPAMAVLYDLEHAGLDLAVVDGRLRVWPVERLTAEHARLIQQYRNALVTLVRICDEGVEARVAAFKQQCANTPADSIPSFLFRPDVPYVKGSCFSCGDPITELRYGRCWRCSLAWRLAAGVPLPAAQAAVYDGARVVA